MKKLEDYVVSIPDYPEPGIIFRDVTSILQDAEGNEVMKYFDAEITDSTSIYLQNMIEEALDDFGDTLEMNQKVAVLVQAIRKLL